MMKIEGPFSFKDIDGLKTPIYIFAPGGVRMEIGEATIHVDSGLTFDIHMEEAYKDVNHAAFDVPMRYAILPHEKP